MHDKINWDDGPQGIFFHKFCKAELSSQRKLEQAQKRAKKIHLATEELAKSQLQNLSNPNLSEHEVKHHKDLCIWCMKGEDTKHPTQDKWCIVQKEDAWNTFKLHTVY